MTAYWTCSECDASGQGDREAEKHVKATRHSVRTSARRP